MQGCGAYKSAYLDKNSTALAPAPLPQLRIFPIAGAGSSRYN